VLRKRGLRPHDYDLHINFPGGVPVDGPSAGTAILVAIYSALTGRPVDNLAAMTGEVSIHGKVKPVGGIVAKVEAARHAGAKRVFIPRENYQALFAEWPDIQVIPVDAVDEVLEQVFGDSPAPERPAPVRVAEPLPAGAAASFSCEVVRQTNPS